MKIIEVSNDQNTVKTDDGKEHEFVESDKQFICKTKCSLQEYDFTCLDYCTHKGRNDNKRGYFQLK